MLGYVSACVHCKLKCVHYSQVPYVGANTPTFQWSTSGVPEVNDSGGLATPIGRTGVRGKVGEKES